MARIRKEEKERIRNKIIEESKLIFVEYGYDKTSIKAIAKAVGIANGTIFNYFESKEEIYLAAIISTSIDAKTSDLALEKKDCLNEQLIKMIEDDVIKSLS